MHHGATLEGGGALCGRCQVHHCPKCRPRDVRCITISCYRPVSPWIMHLPIFHGKILLMRHLRRQHRYCRRRQQKQQKQHQHQHNPCSSSSFRQRITVPTRTHALGPFPFSSPLQPIVSWAHISAIPHLRRRSELARRCRCICHGHRPLYTGLQLYTERE